MSITQEWLTNETVRIAGSIKIKETAVPLHTVVLKKGLLNIEEAVMTEEKKYDRGSKNRVKQT